MNVYDFDGTLYKGDSTVDFWLFCLRQNPALARFMPVQAAGAFLYALRLAEKESFKQYFYFFLRGLEDVDALLDEFWNFNEKKIITWYTAKHKDDDVVISASPEFLLRPICSRIGISRLIASKVDPLTGKCIGKNCEGQEKVRRFHAELGEDARIDEFYSDSQKDAPLARMAKKAFFVKAGSLHVWA